MKTEMTKTQGTRARYTLEFKQETVRVVEGGQRIATAAQTLGVVQQTLFNGVKAQRQGKLTGVDSKPVSTEQMKISRLQAGRAGDITYVATGEDSLADPASSSLLAANSSL